MIDKTTPARPADIRGISDPPDMGRDQHAALKSLTEIADAYELAADEQEEQAGAAWAHEGSSERHAGKAEAFRGIAALLRARVNGISDPPDMGRMKPAEEVARDVIDGDGDLVDVDGSFLEIHADSVGEVRKVLARRIRQWRAEGAAAALEEAAKAVDAMADEQAEVHACVCSLIPLPSHYKEGAFRSVSALLRARIKDISDPPDMG
jgi:hypothetical protein